MAIRKASLEDIGAIALLSSQKREQYEKYQPQFHREALGAMEIQSEFLEDTLSRENVLALVHEGEGGSVNGFVIAAIAKAPPVYDPGGKICFVDDFMVSEPSLWETVGKALLEKVMELGKEKGAVLANVVCGPQDKPKRDMLAKGGFGIATEWNVKPIF